MLNRAAAVLLVADVLERLIRDTSLLRCVREGRALRLALSVPAPWPLLEPLRRLGQAYGIDVHLARDLDARGMMARPVRRTFTASNRRLRGSAVLGLQRRPGH